MTQMRTHTHAHTHMHAHTCAYALACTHTHTKAESQSFIHRPGAHWRSIDMSLQVALLSVSSVNSTHTIKIKE